MAMSSRAMAPWATTCAATTATWLKDRSLDVEPSTLATGLTFEPCCVPRNACQQHFAPRDPRRNEERVGRGRKGNKAHRSVQPVTAPIDGRAGQSCAGVVAVLLIGEHRHRKAGPGKDLGERGPLACACEGQRGGARLQQRHLEQLLARLIENERKIEKAQAEAARILRNQDRRPSRAADFAPRVVVHLLSGVAQRARAPGSADAGAQAHRAVAQQGLLYVQYRVHGISPAGRERAWR